MKFRFPSPALLVACALTLNCAVVAYGLAEDAWADTTSLTFSILDTYGVWLEVPDVGVAWHPSVTAEWRPYTFGHWLWTDRGWFWAGYEPFAWIVDHYGNWIFDREAGWFWVATDEWAPARNAWVSTDSHFGWAPVPPVGFGLRIPWEANATEVWNFVPVKAFAKDNVGKYRTRENALLKYPLGPSGASRQTPDVQVASERAGYHFTKISIRLRKTTAGPDTLLRAQLPSKEAQRISGGAAAVKPLLKPVSASDRARSLPPDKRRNALRQKPAPVDSLLR